MRRVRLLIAVVFAVVLAGCQSVGPPSGLLQVVRAEFGLFNVAGDGKPIFVPSKSVPLVVNQEYGWVITVKTFQPKVKWREEFILPAAPTTWGKQAGSTQTVSQD